MIRTAAVLIVALSLPMTLSACSSDSDPGPGGVTQGEARQLDHAAQMLDQQPRPPLVDATIPADIASGDAQ